MGTRHVAMGALVLASLLIDSQFVFAQGRMGGTKFRQPLAGTWLARAAITITTTIATTPRTVTTLHRPKKICQARPLPIRSVLRRRNRPSTRSSPSI